MNAVKHSSVYIIKKNSLIVSFLKSTFTFSLLWLAVYVSRDSAWWTFVTGATALCLSYVRIISLITKDRNVFESKKDLLAWVNSLPEDNEIISKKEK